jgi:drug/metabolite transporter (DMT)-like permease
MNTYLPNRQPRWKIALAFGAVYVVWGSTYLTIAIALRSFPPFTLAGIRFLTAGILFLGFCKLNRERIPSSRTMLQISFTGVLLLFFGTGSVIWVEQNLDSSLISIIWATLPIWCAMLDRKKGFRAGMSLPGFVGMVTGFVGAVILVSDRDLLSTVDHSHSKLLSFIIAFGGTIVYAVGSLHMKNKPTGTPPHTTAAIQLIAAGLLSIMISCLAGEPKQVTWSEVSSDSILSLIYLIIMGSMMAYLSYVWLISNISPALVGTYTYVNPVIAIMLGWLVAHETISFQQILALLIISSGVLLMNLYKLNLKS